MQSSRLPYTCPDLPSLKTGSVRRGTLLGFCLGSRKPVTLHPDATYLKAGDTLRVRLHFKSPLPDLTPASQTQRRPCVGPEAASL